MHTIRINCGYEFVKLCLRYTARDPRLRSALGTNNICVNSKNNNNIISCVGDSRTREGQIKSILKLILVTAAASSTISSTTTLTGRCHISGISSLRQIVVSTQKAAALKRKAHLIFNRKELNFY